MPPYCAYEDAQSFCGYNYVSYGIVNLWDADEQLLFTFLYFRGVLI